MNLFAEFREGLGISWSAIRANKMRSILTTLGIVIGIVTVTSMATAIDALNRAFSDSISILGADVLFVSRINWQTHTEAEWLQQMRRPEIAHRSRHRPDIQRVPRRHQHHPQIFQFLFHPPIFPL